ASRFVSLDDANPKDRPRLLGLALAELVRSDWAPLVERSAAKEAAATKTGQEPPRPESAAATASAATHEKTSTAAATGSAARGAGPGASPSSEADDADGLAFTAAAIVRWFTAYPGVTLGGALGIERGRFSLGVEAAVGRDVTARGKTNYGFGAATLG